MIEIPKYLKKYIVEQNYDDYSFIDHACWRFIMRLNKQYFRNHAHPKYLEGLDKTGITINQIPKIENIDKKLQKFGWRAVGVRGFLPPLIFMDFQSKGILPIACDMRSMEHLTYTPAPDIVHEAAGHSPMIADSDYAQYLKYYGEIARKAIYSSEDYDLYVAIRKLSDIKENPNSKTLEINKAENNLKDAIKSISYTSEAAFLSRINWWTVEYGLVGDINNPKIYGAGLLSSIGESENCLKDEVKKIPISIDCLNYSYDITEQQPQLFVSKDFKLLVKILDEMSSSMAYKIGGIEGVNKAIQSKSVCTLELDSNIQISGKVCNMITSENSIIYIQLENETQLSIKNKEIDGHGIERHEEGFGAPLGKLTNGLELNKLNKEEFIQSGYKINDFINLDFESGIKLKGVVKSIFEEDNLIKIITFSNCSVKYKNETLFDPTWGEYDMVCGQKIASVFGGPSDIDQYYRRESSNNDISDLNKISKSNIDNELNKIYSKIRFMREQNCIDFLVLEKLANDLNKNHQNDWLAELEIYELSFKTDYDWVKNLEKMLKFKASQKTDLGQAIKKSLQLIETIKV